MTPGRILIAGGSGFLGRALIPALRERGYSVTNLTRSPRYEGDIAWDGRTIGDWASLLEGAEAIINLAGHSLYCHQTPADLRRIVDSRVETVNAIGEAIRRSSAPPEVWIQAGSHRFYGDTGDRTCTEEALPGEGFSAIACLLSEQAFRANAAPGTRQTLLRIADVLGPGGGLLEPLLQRTRRFLGGAVGDGRQYVSWLDIADLNRILLWVLENGSAEGVYNAASPTPIRNAELMAVLRHVLHRPWSPPIPEWAIRLSARWRNTEPALDLASRRCLPERLTAAGFSFAYPDLKDSIRRILQNPADA